MVEMKKEPEQLLQLPAKVKLQKMWMMDQHHQSLIPSTYMISHGIWLTTSMFMYENKRAFELTCIVSYHSKIKIGDTKRMYEGTIIAVCHEVELIHLPKIECAYE